MNNRPACCILAMTFVVGSRDLHHHVPGIIPDHGMHQEAPVPIPNGAVSGIYAGGTAVRAYAGVAVGTATAYNPSVEIG